MMMQMTQWTYLGIDETSAYSQAGLGQDGQGPEGKVVWVSIEGRRRRRGMFVKQELDDLLFLLLPILILFV